MEDVFAYLDRFDIEYVNHTHPPVYTVEEARQYREGIEGIHCKNLFLEDSKRGEYYLLTSPADKSFRLNSIRKQIKAKKLSFANPEHLKEILGLEPGSVSPLGLINDLDDLTTYLIDQRVWNTNRVTFHPNTNTMTLELSGVDFQRLVKSFGNRYLILDIEETE
jgi:Ala-tRNA(Pro) deacylase